MSSEIICQHKERLQYAAYVTIGLGIVSFIVLNILSSVNVSSLGEVCIGLLLFMMSPLFVVLILNKLKNKPQEVASNTLHESREKNTTPQGIQHRYERHNDHKRPHFELHKALWALQDRYNENFRDCVRFREEVNLNDPNVEGWEGIFYSNSFSEGFEYLQRFGKTKIDFKMDTATLGHVLGALVTAGVYLKRKDVTILYGMRSINIPVLENLDVLMKDLLKHNMVDWKPEHTKKPCLNLD